jgi:hypothetical protein
MLHIFVISFLALFLRVTSALSSLLFPIFLRISINIVVSLHLFSTLMSAINVRVVVTFVSLVFTALFRCAILIIVTASLLFLAG